MTREEKSIVIKELTDKLAETSSIYFTDISGLNAQNTNKLRRACFKANIKLLVVKNTLMAKAMGGSDTSVMFSETGNGPAKVIKDFRKKNEKPILKGAFVDEAIYLGDDYLETLVNIKSKEEVVGDIISLLQSPAKNVISALQSGGGKLAGILKTLSEKES